MLDENPYQPVLSNGTTHTRTRIATAVWWTIYLHPAIALALVYACWTVTTVSLGRPPGFGEHPENELAHSVVHMLDACVLLLVLATPILVPIALVWGLSQPFAMSHQTESLFLMRVACLATYPLMLMAVTWVCYSDPFRVVYWYMD